MNYVTERNLLLKLGLKRPSPGSHLAGSIPDSSPVFTGLGIGQKGSSQNRNWSRVGRRFSVPSVSQIHKTISVSSKRTECVLKLKVK